MIHDDDKNIDAITALAEAWASIDGKLEYFLGGKEAETFEEETTTFRGHYSGYMIEAEEMIKRIEKRGFTITPL